MAYFCAWLLQTNLFPFQNGFKEFMKDVVLWVHPFLSASIFVAWMHCVYTNSLAYVPVYLLLGLNTLLYSNYCAFVIDDGLHAGFAPVTFLELFKCLFFGGDKTNYLRAIDVASHDMIQKSSNSASYPDSDERSNTLRPIDHMITNSSVKVDEDHAGKHYFRYSEINLSPFLIIPLSKEFPFSEKNRYPKKNLAEACSDAQNCFLDEDDSEAAKSSRIASEAHQYCLNAVILYYNNPFLLQQRFIENTNGQAERRELSSRR
jgi:hypothetical protein